MSEHFRVDIRVRNNHLLTAIEERFGSIRAFSVHLNCRLQRLYDIVNLRKSPTDENWWTDEALIIADALMMPPEDLWPDALATMELERNTGTSKVSHQHMLSFIGQSDPLEQARLAQLPELIEVLMSDSLNTLQRTVIRRRFGMDGEAETLEQIAKSMGCTRERIRQIEAKAMRKMRHPVRSEPLVDAVDLDTEAYNRHVIIEQKKRESHASR